MAVGPDVGPTADGGALRIGPASRLLRRALRPIDWVLLEDLALDARPDAAGRLVAPTSARQVAEHLGLTPGAVAGALTRLRSAGHVTHARQAGPAGRFGLSVYVLGPVPGLEVLGAPDGIQRPRPRTAPPAAVSPCAVEPYMARPTRGRRSKQAGAKPQVPAGRDRVAPEASPGGTPLTDTRRRPVVDHEVAQLSILDLTDDADADPRRDATPTPVTTSEQRPSARHADAVPRPPAPSA